MLDAGLAPDADLLDALDREARIEDPAAKVLGHRPTVAGLPQPSRRGPTRLVSPQATEASRRAIGGKSQMENRGLEPLTSAVRSQRSTS